MDALDQSVSALLRTVGEEIILPRFGDLAAHHVSEKTPGELVTIVDHEAEQRLTEGLASILPEARVVGEEAVAADPEHLKDLARGGIWLVDPLDGTANFVSGRTPFAIMIALLSDGETEASWILDPVSGRQCSAFKGRGAYIDGQPFHARATGAPLPVAALATHFIPQPMRRTIERRAEGRFEIAPIPRCAGEQYPRVVDGTNDVALFWRTLPWDHAPGALFVEEAGGRVARPDGRPYRAAETETGLLAAASPQLWDKAAAILFSD